MLRFIVVLFITLCVSTAVATAQEPLSPEHEHKSRLFDVATVGDVATTIVGLGCSTIKELNPILKGANPAGVVGFFVVRNVLYHKLTASIPAHYRDAWLNTTIGAQTLVVLNNVAVIGRYC